ncbi:hypothetical protein RTBOTA2_006538 [Rhodotorula toruloides]|nr:hypothetical protein RTBOTA2_006538 [Rhodotorula toruloides]
MSRTTSADHLAPRSLPRLAILCALIFLSAFLPAAAAQDSSDTTVYTTYTDNGSIETWYASTPATPTPTWSSMGGVEAATSYLSNLEAYSATATATSDATSGGASRRPRTKKRYDDDDDDSDVLLRFSPSSSSSSPSTFANRRSSCVPPISLIAAHKQRRTSKRSVHQPTQQHPQRHSNLARNSQCDGDDR